MQIAIKGHQYSIGKMDVFTQFHVARRLTPLLYSMGAARLMAMRAPAADMLADADQIGQFIASAGPMIDVLAHMSDADSQYILDKTLLVVSRESGVGFQRIMTEGSKRLQFEDIDLAVMLQLAFVSVQESLGNFLPALPESPTAAENTPA